MNLTVLDADSLIFGAIWRNSDSTPPQMFGEVSSFVERILHETEATHYLGFLGGIGNFRHQAATTKPYKGNRKEELESVKYWRPLIKEYLVKEWGFTLCHGIEADDACSIAHKLYSSSADLTTAHLDWDLDQLSGKHYNYSKGLHYSLSERESSYNLHHQLLTGCTGDSVPGLPRVGEVKATAILKDCPDHTYHWMSVECAYADKLGIPHYADYLTEQYTLLKLLETGEKYGFTCPTPLPVPTSSLLVEEDISHLFM